MDNDIDTLSERVIYTVAEVLDKDPIELPPLEETISADALDELFHRKTHPAGAFTVFPYCELWVVAHSRGSVDIFETYHTTTAGEQFPDSVPEPSADERVAVLHFEGERYTIGDDQLDTVHEIVAEADTSGEAWDETIQFARAQAD